MNLETGFARCSSCDAVFDFSRIVRGEGDGGSGSHVGVGSNVGVGPASSPPRPEVAMPRGIVIEDLGRDLTIDRRWFSPGVLFLLLFAGLWDGFLIVTWTASFANGGGSQVLLFTLLHAIAGAFLSYIAAASFLNTTRIAVDRDTLTVRHGPLPWPGAREIRIDRIEQFFTKEKMHRGKHGVSYTYEVHVNERGEEPRKIVSGLRNKEQALFIEQALERHLHLADTPVPGEFTR
jgi:hypothetical protein